jgi:hypothetical protein
MDMDIRKEVTTREGVEVAAEGAPRCGFVFEDLGSEDAT